MGWTYDINITGSTSRRTLATAVIVLAAMVILLWFGSLRSADPASADGPRSFAECPQPTFEECDEVISGVRPLVEPPSASASYAPAEQGAAGRGFLNIQTLESTAVAVREQGTVRCPLIGPTCFDSTTSDTSGQNTEGCLLPGIPCFEGDGFSYAGQLAGGSRAFELRTF